MRPETPHFAKPETVALNLKETEIEFFFGK
jgi:hypothetical protein